MNTRDLTNGWVTIYRHLMPPRDIGPEKVGFWIRRMAISIMALAALMIIQYVLIYGLIETELMRIGSRDIEGIKQRVEDMEDRDDKIMERLTDLSGVARRGEIIDIKKLHCDALSAGSQSAARRLNLMMANLSIEYRARIGSSVEIPSCRQIGINVDET